MKSMRSIHGLAISIYLCTTPFATHTTTENTHLSREYVLLAREKEQDGKLHDAIRFYEKAHTLDPDCIDSYFYLGNIYFKQHDIEKTVSYYKKAIELRPDCAEIHCNLGICANLQSQPGQAIQHFKNAIEADFTFSTAHLQLALTLEKQKKYDEALVYFEHALTHDPKNTDIPSHVGNTLKKLERFEEAAEFFQKAYFLKPNDLNAALELANVLNVINRNQESLDLYVKILEKHPTLTGVLYNFGFTLKKMGHIAQAIEVYKQVIEQKPDYALAHFSLGLSYLALGEFDKGWLEYEWRWEAYKEKPKQFEQPMWDGSDLHDKTIYVYAEQGYGDTFQFIRYLAELKKRGAHVIFQPQRPLKDILKLCPYIDTIITHENELKQFDYHIALMSLPLMFNTTKDTVPNTIPYLYADDTLVAQWKQKLPLDKKFKIGICWQGNAQYQTANLRRAVAAKSLHVNHFMTLAHIPGVQLYSLQHINGVDQLKELKDVSLINVFDGDFDQSHGRFMDTAAVIKNLDLVITIDTSIGHFAAALGTPTWILLPNPPDWRWMFDCDDTPWYPNVRLFRQPTLGDWDSVMQTIATAIAEQLTRTNQSAINTTDHPLTYIKEKLKNHIAALNTKKTHSLEHHNALATAYALQRDITHHNTTHNN